MEIGKGETIKRVLSQGDVTALQPVCVDRRIEMGPRPLSRYESTLASDTQFLDELLIPLRLFGFQILEKPASPGHQQQQTLAGVMVFFVGLEVFRELGNAPAQDRHLHFWRARIGFVNPKLANNDLFASVARATQE